MLLVSEFIQTLYRLSALYHHMSTALVCIESFSSYQRLTKASIARMARSTRNYQISHTGKTHACERVSPKCHNDAAELGDTSRHKSRKRIVPRTASDCNATRNGNHVFGGSARFHASHVIAYVRSELSTRNGFLKPLSTRKIFGGNNCRRKALLDNFFCVIGA